MSKPSQFVLDEDRRLYHLGVTAGDVAPNLVLVGDPARAERVAARFDEQPRRFERREFVTLTGAVRGLPVTALGTGIGTDNVEIAVLEAWATLALDLATQKPRPDAPAVRMLRVGTSGGAQPDVPPGTLCAAEYALGLDSTGLYFDVLEIDRRCLAIEEVALERLRGATSPGARFAGGLRPYVSRGSLALLSHLREAADAAGEELLEGITVSAPGFYGASSRRAGDVPFTVPDIKGVLAGVEVDGRRVLNFEMESSLLFLLAQALGFDSGTVCPVISQPQSHGEVPPYAPRVERAIDVALDALARAAAG